MDCSSKDIPRAQLSVRRERGNRCVLKIFRTLWNAKDVEPTTRCDRRSLHRQLGSGSQWVARARTHQNQISRFGGKRMCVLIIFNQSNLVLRTLSGW